MDNKYSQTKIKISDGSTIDLSRRVFIPTENKKGFFKTHDGTLYRRDDNGTIRKIDQK
jgi:hypothetical protein